MSAGPAHPRRRLIRALALLWVGGAGLFLLLVLTMWLGAMPFGVLVAAMPLHLPLAFVLAVMLGTSPQCRRSVAAWLLAAYYAAWIVLLAWPAGDGNALVAEPVRLVAGLAVAAFLALVAGARRAEESV